MYLLTTQLGTRARYFWNMDSTSEGLAVNDLLAKAVRGVSGLGFVVGSLEELWLMIEDGLEPTVRDLFFWEVEEGVGSASEGVGSVVVVLSIGSGKTCDMHRGWSEGEGWL